ncbi:MAG TPA: GNAT family N-acetyltransferase [Paenisporosarcina sp.]|nr:GNAT family N-acetyltransferase [Paenisporosarcina sp.]
MFHYKELSIGELQDDFLSSFNRFQETHQVLVTYQDELIMKKDYFVDDWNHEMKSAVVHSLRYCIQAGGSVIGVYRERELIAFANVENAKFGTNSEYVELPYIHVSKELRGRGIGKRLFEICCEKAKQLGAEKLYIAAHPAVETQHFYKQMGCTLALEINPQILNKEPLDLQLEYSL